VSLSDAPDGRRPDSSGVPRWVALIVFLFVWLVGVPLVHALLPWAISLLTHRVGWAEGRPGGWNLLGLIPVSVGAACLVWSWLPGCCTGIGFLRG
jgi:hypothetical protein